MLTKEQVAKLPIEDQETLAKVELGRARRRQLLLQQARGKGDWRSVFMAVYIILCAASSCFYYAAATRTKNDLQFMRF